MNPSIGKRNCGVGDESRRMQIKQLGVALVEEGCNGFRPLAALHVVDHNSIVIFVQLGEEQQGFGASVTADELIYGIAMHHAAAFGQKRLKISHRIMGLPAAFCKGAEFCKVQLGEPRANHCALSDVSEGQVRELVDEKAHERLAVSCLLDTQDDLLEWNVGLRVPISLLIDESVI